MNRLIMRRFEFDAAHRLLNHEGACRFIHGHRYAAEVAVTGENLDGVGRLIDFKEMKDRIKGWIDEHWDHNLILNDDDLMLDAKVPLYGTSGRLIGDQSIFEYQGRDPYRMPGNPTAENLAEELFKWSNHILAIFDLKVVSVRLWETPSCAAEFFA